MNEIQVHTFYQFKTLSEDQLPEIKKDLVERALAEGICGLVILGTEGINTTLSGEAENLARWEIETQHKLGLDPLNIRVCPADHHPFKRFNVKVRKEIVTLQREDIIPNPEQPEGHISPEEWDRLMEDPNTLVVDTRNDYEVEIGKFKGAVDLDISEFAEFPEKVREQNWDKDKNYLIYCTGGIRCEKAIFSMKEQGFKNVYQLEGGIISYLKERPNKNYEGDCFVFDSRVAVDQELKPTEQYSLCPHCGEVAKIAITCRKCDSEAMICPACSEKIPEQNELETCSKNCAYHYKRDPHTKSPQQRRHYHQPA